VTSDGPGPVDNDAQVNTNRLGGSNSRFVTGALVRLDLLEHDDADGAALACLEDLRRRQIGPVVQWQLAA